jgi:hypothetical protein
VKKRNPPTGHRVALAWRVAPALTSQTAEEPSLLWQSFGPVATIARQSWAISTHIRSSVCAPLCRYQMPDRRRALRLETIHSVLQHAIGIGHALVLSHVVEPGIDAECLDEDTLF